MENPMFQEAKLCIKLYMNADFLVYRRAHPNFPKQ